MNNYRLIKSMLSEHLGKDDFTQEDVEGIETNDERLNGAKSFYLLLMQNDFDEETYQGGLDYFSDRVDYHLNLKCKHLF